MDNLLNYRIENLIEHIDLVLSDTKDVSFEELTQNSLLLRATCFSIAHIGEMMVQLEKSLYEEFPNLPWQSARKMRNVIVHDYKGAELDTIYLTIHNNLPELKDMFLEILKNLSKAV